MLVLGIVAVLAVMILTAIFHVIAPYVAALLVLVAGGWILSKLLGGSDDKTQPEDPPS